MKINELGQIKKGHRGLQCWSCGGLDHLQRDCKWVVMMMINSMDLTKKLVICAIPPITESDVTSSMMGEMYRQLASAQLREDYIKQGIEEQKLLLERYR